MSEIRYKAWGEVRYASGATPTDYKYTGQLEDSYIKLYWMGSRWYDEEQGRFIQADSIVPSIGEGNNPYAVGYVKNSNYSALIVDYHENQFLEQSNQENRIRLANPYGKLHGVPTNPVGRLHKKKEG